MDFERWFSERTSRFERVLIKSTVLLLFLLLVSQALLTNSNVRGMLSLVERLEGAPYEQGALDEEREAVARPPAPDGPLYLELSVANDADASKLSVHVNGEAVMAFGSNNRLEVPVEAGDLVEVDGYLSEHNIEIVVSAISEGVLSPYQGQTVTFFGRPETISWVVVEGN